MKQLLLPACFACLTQAYAQHYAPGEHVRDLPRAGDYDKQTFWFISSGTPSPRSGKRQTYDVPGRDLPTYYDEHTNSAASAKKLFTD